MMALKGLLAGIAIAFGGMLFLLVMTFVPAPINKILGALVFPIGLSIVCLCSLFLFTGKIGLIFEKKQDSDYYLSLPIMYIFNLLGAGLMGYLCYLIFKNTDIYLKVASIAFNKTNFTDVNSYFSIFFKALLCGLCVYLAVRFFATNKHMVTKLICVFLFIGVFVYMGWEHCIANAYYFMFANALNANSIANIAIVTLGNILGTLPGILLFKAAKRID